MTSNKGIKRSRLESPVLLRCVYWSFFFPDFTLGFVTMKNTHLRENDVRNAYSCWFKPGFLNHQQGCAAPASNFSKPAYNNWGNRQIEDAFLFLLTLGLRSERRRDNATRFETFHLLCLHEMLHLLNPWSKYMAQFLKGRSKQGLYKPIHSRRKFRSLTSDNMQSWKAE